MEGSYSYQLVHVHTKASTGVYRSPACLMKGDGDLSGAIFTGSFHSVVLKLNGYEAHVIIEVILNLQLQFLMRSRSSCKPKHARGTSLAQLVKQGMEFKISQRLNH